MGRLTNQLRRARTTWFAGAVRDTASASADALAPQFAELRRILGDQADASDQVAEALGRMLARLNGELEAMSAEVARLHERLDRMEALR